MATSNNDWLHIYQHNLSASPPPPPPPLRWPGHLTDATTTTMNSPTTTTTTTTAATSTSSTSHAISNQLGRVTRPTNNRRRTRASRRTPTTLLNTDTTNFRAMVQQFTGGNFTNIGSAAGGGGGGSNVFMGPPATGYSTNSSGFSYYAAGTGVSSPAAVGYGYNMEFRQPLQHQNHYYTAAAENGGEHQHGFV